jgi:hypothetical protein
MKIFEGISARFKAKICRRTGVLQKFLTRKMTEIHQKDSCERLCEHALAEIHHSKEEGSLGALA